MPSRIAIRRTGKARHGRCANAMNEMLTGSIHLLSDVDTTLGTGSIADVSRSLCFLSMAAGVGLQARIHRSAVAVSTSLQNAAILAASWKSSSLQI